MSAITEITEAFAEAVVKDEPVVGHRAWVDWRETYPYRALCGARIVGIALPSDTQICPDCEAALEAFVAGRLC